MTTFFKLKTFFLEFKISLEIKKKNKHLIIAWSKRKMKRRWVINTKRTHQKKKMVLSVICHLKTVKSALIRLKSIHKLCWKLLCSVYIFVLFFLLFKRNKKSFVSGLPFQDFFTSHDAWRKKENYYRTIVTLSEKRRQREKKRAKVFEWLGKNYSKTADVVLTKKIVSNSSSFTNIAFFC